MKKLKPFKFVSKYQDGIWTYYYTVSDENRLISVNQGITANKNLSSPGEIYFFDFYVKYNIAIGNTSENDLLYMLLVWELKENLSLLGLNSDCTSGVKHELKQSPTLVNWEYSLGQKLGVKNLDMEDGFTNPPTPSRQPLWDTKTPKDKVGLFRLNSFQELADFFKATPDLYRLLNFYLTETPEVIIEQLKEDRKPDFDSLMNLDTIFIGMFIGDEPDSFEHDYLIIKSKKDITNILNPLTEKITRFAHDYLASTQDIKKINHLTRLVEELLKKYEFSIK